MVEESQKRNYLIQYYEILLSSRVERWYLNWLFTGHKVFNKVMGRKKSHTVEL